MELTPSERAVLDRYAEKCHLAGGPRVGYVLRERAIRYHEGEHPELDFDAALTGLVEKDLLKAGEGGEFYFLTAAGAELLG